ncbi:M28 family metallopeptidase [Aliiglaciecola sp. M165]|uniref:M28 family metallopeptidase n=1 Tax=Aliiglaciecola sp. M165 TaxID=2593649 RepID=UPI00117DC400|nr:M28 family metallopeptidase [Aliiglaciecola sp. M165]TRY34077.1 M28 family peptidase [Aliiglaciecola sp. M165]
MKIKSISLGLIGTIMIAACQSSQTNNGTTADLNAQAEVHRIKSHIYFLADDLLGGRDTGSAGHEIASKYIESEFKKYGLSPAGDEGTYFQRIAFRQAFIDQSSPELIIQTPKGEKSFDYPKDFIAYANAGLEESLVQGNLVFAGYGITAPELGHDDYAGLDVKGKVIVALSGKPVSFPSEEGAHFGSGAEKRKHAIANGAIGYVTIPTPLSEKVSPYLNSLNYLHVPTVRFLGNDGNPVGAYEELGGGALLHRDVAAQLFEDAPMSLETIYAELEEGRTPKGFDLPASIKLSSKSTFKQITSPNVVAMLEGSDPTLKNEYVVYSAHSDHIGFAKTVKKDNINNGAMDNASGTSVMLETARLFSQLPQRPKRSIIFLAVTGEEKGLLGSKYFAQNPTVPAENIVANVNLDMPILTYEFGDVIAFGANHSDMQESVALAAKNVGIELSPDPWPQLALFTRSDHYGFVQQGIPSVFLVPGLKSADPDVDGSKQFNNFLATHYHKPTDDLNQTFNWKAAKKFTEVNFQIGLTLSNQPKRSQWNEGDFFGGVFSK